MPGRPPSNNGEGQGEGDRPEDTYGSADVLELRDAEDPVADENDVLVRVHAAGRGPDVWHLMTGMPYLARLAIGLRRPEVGIRITV